MLNKKMMKGCLILSVLFTQSLTVSATESVKEEQNTAVDIVKLDASVAKDVQEKKDFVKHVNITEFESIQTTSLFNFDNYESFGLVRNVEQNINIYPEKNLNTREIATLELNGKCTILEESGDWYKIKSGDFEGWALKKYIISGKDAVMKANEITKEYVKVKEDILSYQDEYCLIKSDTLKKGDKYQRVSWIYNPQTDEKIICLTKDNRNFYIKAENIETYYDLNTAKEAIRLEEDIVNYAKSFIGNPYVWGGTNPHTGADCSGFVQYIYNHFGYSLPRTTGAQWDWGVSNGKVVSTSEAQAGDLVLYRGHVAMLTGNGNEIVHASNSAPYPQGGIKITSDYNYEPILGIVRVI